jgi:hypothetical protein
MIGNYPFTLITIDGGRMVSASDCGFVTKTEPVQGIIFNMD